MSLVLHFDGLPGRTLTLWLFRNISNAREIRELVQARKCEPECSFIDAKLALDCWIIHLAAFKALIAEQNEALKSRSLHGELVYNLSGSKHIMESLKRFGISEETTDVLAARFDCNPKEEEEVKKLVKGDLQPLDQLDSLADLQALKQYHKWSAGEEKLDNPLGAIVTRIAARDF